MICHCTDVYPELSSVSLADERLNGLALMYVHPDITLGYDGVLTNLWNRIVGYSSVSMLLNGTLLEVGSINTPIEQTLLKQFAMYTGKLHINSHFYSTRYKLSGAYNQACLFVGLCVCHHHHHSFCNKMPTQRSNYTVAKISHIQQQCSSHYRSL